MRPKLVDFLNQIFGTNIFSWLVSSSAFIHALMMFVCIFFIYRRSRSKKLSQYHALGGSVWAMIGGLLGARIFYLLIHIEQLIAKPGIIFDITGGTASWGVYIGGCLAFLLYFNNKKEPFYPYADLLVSFLGLGPFIGRWSCFLNGCCFGEVAMVPWAVAFPRGSYAFHTHVQLGLLDPGASCSLPVHPLQLYLSLNGLILFLIFTWLWNHKKFPPGILFWLYWATYGFTRFFLEFFRDENITESIGVFSLPQLMTILLFICSVAAIIILVSKQRPLDQST